MRRCVLLAVVGFVVLSACSKQASLDVVRNGTMPGFESTTVGKAFNGSFDNCQWETTETSKGKNIVIFRGNISKKLHDAVVRDVLGRLEKSDNSPNKIQSRITLFTVSMEQIIGKKPLMFASGNGTPFFDKLNTELGCTGIAWEGGNYPMPQCPSPDSTNAYIDRSIQEGMRLVWVEGAPVEATWAVSVDKKSFKLEGLTSRIWDSVNIQPTLEQIYKDEPATSESTHVSGKQEDQYEKVYDLYLQCVARGFDTIDGFCNADRSAFYYYNTVFDETKFFDSCKASIANNTTMDYSSFKTSVCTKPLAQEAHIDGKAAEGITLTNKDNKIYTRFGPATMRVDENNISDQKSYVVLPDSKLYEIKGAGDHPRFYDKCYKINNDNIYFIVTGAGNSAEWSYMIVEKSDGIFISDPDGNDSLPYPSISKMIINGNKFIMSAPYRYGQEIVVTYEKGKLARKGNFNSKNGMMTFDVKDIKMVNIFQRQGISNRIPLLREMYQWWEKLKMGHG